MTPNADDILATPVSAARKILGSDPDTVRKAFRRLAHIWHPDRSPDPRAGAVFAHLVSLRDAFKGGGEAKSASTRNVGASRIFERAGGRKFSMGVLRAHAIDIGEVLVGRHSLAWRFDAGAKDLAEAEISRIAGLKFANTAMEREMRRFLPQLSHRIDLADGGMMLVQPRNHDEVLLCDLIESYNGHIPAEHVAWIGSGLFHIACWLDWAEIVHGAISPEMVTIVPGTHDVRLVGGFGFITPSGVRPATLPSRTLSIVPILGIKGQVADRTLDAELIRATLQDALGGRVGVPDPVMHALHMPPDKTAIADYKAWSDALEAAWGRRRFQVMPRSGRNIYESG